MASQYCIFPGILELQNLENDYVTAGTDSNINVVGLSKSNFNHMETVWTKLV